MKIVKSIIYRTYFFFQYMPSLNWGLINSFHFFYLFQQPSIKNIQLKMYVSMIDVQTLEVVLYPSYHLSNDLCLNKFTDLPSQCLQKYPAVLRPILEESMSRHPLNLHPLSLFPSRMKIRYLHIEIIALSTSYFIHPEYMYSFCSYSHTCTTEFFESYVGLS